MKQIVTLFLLLSTLAIRAQQHTADSLKKVIVSAKEDTTKTLAIGALGRLYVNIKPDTSILLATQGIALSKKNILFKR